MYLLRLWKHLAVLISALTHTDFFLLRWIGQGGSLPLVNYSMIILKRDIFSFNDCCEVRSHSYHTDLHWIWHLTHFLRPLLASVGLTIANQWHLFNGPCVSPFPLPIFRLFNTVYRTLTNVWIRSADIWWVSDTTSRSGYAFFTIIMQLYLSFIDCWLDRPQICGQSNKGYCDHNLQLQSRK